MPRALACAQATSPTGDERLSRVSLTVLIPT